MKKNKNNGMLFWALQKKVLIPSMNFANHSKSKNMSVGKVCIKCFELACMAILSPETVSIWFYVNVPLWICKYRLFQLQISPRRLKFWPKTHPKCIKNAHRGNHKSKKFSGGDTPSRIVPTTRAFGTHFDFHRTTFKYLVTDGPTNMKQNFAES